MEHINDVCNLSELTNKAVEFKSTDQFALTETLSDTGSIIILRDGDRHDIYVAGEHIAGGWGFDSYSYMANISSIAGDANIDSLTYILENSYSLSTLIGDRNNALGGSTSDVDTTLPEEETSFTIDGMTYTLAKNTAGGLYYEREGDTVLSNVMFDYNDSAALSTDPIIMKAGTTVTIDEITFNIKGNKDITGLSVMLASEWNRLSRPRKAAFEPDETVTIECPDNEPYAETPYTLRDNLSFSSVGTKTAYTEKLVVIYKYNQNADTEKIETIYSQPIYWQLPMYAGIDDFTAIQNMPDSSLIYREDISVDSVPTADITIDFNNDWSDMQYGIFACPTTWGTPSFILKNTNIKHKWDCISTNVAGKIGTTTVLYNVYRTPHKYYGSSVTWTVTK